VATRERGFGFRPIIVLLASCALMAAGAPLARAAVPHTTMPARTPLDRGLWSSRYTNGFAGYNVAKALVASPDGSQVFVTGRSSAFGTGDDYATIAYDAGTGAQQWAARYNGLANQLDSPSGIAVSPDGARVFVTGGTIEQPGVGTATTIAYDTATGSQLWISKQTDAGANAIGISPDGTKVFVTGTGTGIEQDYATIAYQATTGAFLWSATYDRDGSSDRANALVVSPDGSKVFVTGESVYFESDFDYATIAYDTMTGAQLWVARYDATLNVDEATAIGVSPDGGKVFVTGDSSGGPVTTKDYATVAYDAAAGTQVWVSRYNGPGNTYDVPTDLGVSPDGSSVFVTGFPATIAYKTSSGVQAWLSTGFGVRVVTGSALDVRPDGSRLYVVGTTAGAGNDWATVAYDPVTGAGIWIARLGSQGSDAAKAVGVSPSGSEVFVAGSVQVRQLGFTDIETAAYTP
jgi:putative pyrroloquinoline-quinone binding quinoprotein